MQEEHQKLINDLFKYKQKKPIFWKIIPYLIILFSMGMIIFIILKGITGKPPEINWMAIFPWVAASLINITPIVYTNKKEKEFRSNLINYINKNMADLNKEEGNRIYHTATSGDEIYTNSKKQYYLLKISYLYCITITAASLYILFRFGFHISNKAIGIIITCGFIYYSYSIEVDKISKQIVKIINS